MIGVMTVDDLLDPAARLRTAGLKVTKGRVAALEALGRHSHATADQLRGHIAERGVQMSLQAVYLSLQVLTDHQTMPAAEWRELGDALLAKPVPEE